MKALKMIVHESADSSVFSVFLHVFSLAKVPVLPANIHVKGFCSASTLEKFIIRKEINNNCNEAQKSLPGPLRVKFKVAIFGTRCCIKRYHLC